MKRLLFQKVAFSPKAAISDAASHIAKYIRENPAIVAGGVGGGLLTGAGAYGASKPGKDGLSSEQKASRAASKGNKKKEDEGLGGGLKRIGTGTWRQVSDLAAKHPAAAALASIPAGAGAGMWIAGKLKKAEADVNTKGLLKIADEWGRSIARTQHETREQLYAETEKVAVDLRAIGKAVGSAGQHVMRTPVGKRMAIGAGVGAASNLVGSNDHSIGSMAGSAATGAVAGAAAKPALKALRGKVTRVTGNNPVTRGVGVLRQGVSEGLKGWQHKE